MRRPARHAARAADTRLEARGLRSAALLTRFRMPSRRDAVAPTVERILAAARSASLDDEQVDNLAVALAEALSNAAVHGNRLDERRMVRVAVAVRPGNSVAVEVSDSGAGFDLSSVSDPTDADHLLVPGGRGVFLMRRLVDELKYNDQGNRVRMLVRARRA